MESVNKLQFKIKKKFNKIEPFGLIMIDDNNVKVFWNDQLVGPSYFSQFTNGINSLQDFYNDENINENCSKNFVYPKIFEQENDQDEEQKKSQTIISELKNAEWWTMVNFFDMYK